METAAQQRREQVRAALADALVQVDLPELPPPQRGKVRDNWDLGDGRLILIATDRQSAFDQVLAAVPFKGQVLTQTARFWFERTADICRNHVLAFPDPNVTIARRLTMLPVEVIVRDYLTGTTATSIWPMYRDGRRLLYGIRFPDGLRQNQQLPQTIVTPTTKGDVGAHDEPLSADDVVSRGLLAPALWEEVQARAVALFARGRELAAGRGLILADTKYEFGIDDDGRVVLADEVHTPDSSRWWQAETYAERFERGADPEALDKDFLRRWIIARCDPYTEPIPPIPADTLIEFALRYIANYELVTGEIFDVPVSTCSPDQRIVANIRRYLTA